MLCGSLDGRGEWIHVYVWLSTFAVHLKITTALLIRYTPIQNKRFKVKKGGKGVSLPDSDLLETRYQNVQRFPLGSHKCVGVSSSECIYSHSSPEVSIPVHIRKLSFIELC